MVRNKFTVVYSVVHDTFITEPSVKRLAPDPSGQVNVPAGSGCGVCLNGAYSERVPVYEPYCPRTSTT